MTKNDLNKMYDIANEMLSKEEKKDKKNYIRKHYEEIKALLNIIKEENPDGFWYYSKGYEPSALFFLNMITPYCSLVEKSYKIKQQWALRYMKPTCSIEQIDKALDTYRYNKRVHTLESKKGVLLAIKNQTPVQYLTIQAQNMVRYLRKASLIEEYNCGDFEEHERVIYYIK